LQKYLTTESAKSFIGFFCGSIFWLRLEATLWIPSGNLEKLSLWVLARIVGTILQDQNSVLTVSTYLNGEYGLRDVCLGIPCIVGQGGVKRIVQAELYPEEQSALENSANTLKERIASLKQVEKA